MAITLTEMAAGRVREHLTRRGNAVGLRVGVAKSGCSGFAYVIDFAQEVEPDDVVFESHGVKVIVNPESLEYIDGTEVDFGREGLNQSFKFNNPKVTATCGCGESFTV